jgi:hypothetical protein
MKFCPVVPEICRGQFHGERKERRITRTRTIIIIIIIRNGAKTISLQTLFGRLNNSILVILWLICSKDIYISWLSGHFAVCVHVPDKYNILLCTVLFLQYFLCKIDVHILHFFNVHNRRQFLQKVKQSLLSNIAWRPRLQYLRNKEQDSDWKTYWGLVTSFFHQLANN